MENITINGIEYMPVPKCGVAKQPTILLTTEDGVSVTDENIDIYALNTDGFWTWGLLTRDTDLSLKNRKYFSTEAARDEYILYNKPISVTLKELFEDYNANLTNLWKDDVIAFFKSKQNL